MSLTGNAEGKVLRGKINKLYELKGYSAYEVAVLNGFSGTEEEWLASLKGDRGDQGVPGAELPVVEISAEEYKALQLAGQLQSDVLYLITDEKTIEERTDDLEAAVDALEKETEGLTEANEGTQKTLLDHTQRIENIEHVYAQPHLALFANMWTNNSPTSDFAAQTIEMDLTNYSAVVVGIKFKTDMGGVSYHIIPIGNNIACQSFCTNIIAERNISVTSTGVTFGSGQWNTTNASFLNTNNSYAIPTEIYVL